MLGTPNQAGSAGSETCFLHSHCPCYVESNNACPDPAWGQRMVQKADGEDDEGPRYCGQLRHMHGAARKMWGQRRGARALGAGGITACPRSWVGCLGQEEEEEESCPCKTPGTRWVLHFFSWMAGRLTAGSASPSHGPAHLPPVPWYQPGAGLWCHWGAARSLVTILAVGFIPLSALLCLPACCAAYCQRNAPNTRIAAVISALSLLKLLLSPD